MPKLALVSGGSKGIGLAIAMALAEAGYQTWIAARTEKCLVLACQTAEARGLKLHSLRMDIQNQREVEAAFERLHKEAGETNVFVHSAGTEAFSILESPEDPEHWLRTINTNLNGAYYCGRAAALQMRENKSGRIIFVSSVLGLRGMRHSHAYSASKHGVLGLMRSMAQDLSDQGITVNAVCPGWVRTEMGVRSMSRIARHYDLEPEMFIEAELAAIPIQRWIEPEEIAAMVLYLCSAPAAAVTGQTFEISGGL